MKFKFPIAWLSAATQHPASKAIYYMVGFTYSDPMDSWSAAIEISPSVKKLSTPRALKNNELF